MTMQPLKELINRWVTPAGLAILLGFIIWLVQLNGNAITSAERIAVLEAADAISIQTLNEVAVTMSRLQALQDAQFDMIDDLQGRMERNEALIYKNSNHGGEGG